MKLNRILRNQEGSSPGGGVTPPASVDPAAQTGTQTAAPAIPVDALKGAVTEAIAAVLPDLRNGIFADLRKAGAFKQGKSEESPATPAPQQTTSTPTAAAALSMADVESMLERERVITARATKHDLSDAQIRRMKSALAGVTPDQFAFEADSFLSDLGLAKAPTSTAQQAQTTVVPTGPAQPPISDKGSPAPGGVLDWEREYAENPIGMSSAARQRMDAKYGPEKARRMRVEAAQRQAEAIKVERPRG